MKQKFRNDGSLDKGLWGIKCPQNGRANEKQSLSLHDSANAHCCTKQQQLKWMSGIS